MENYEECAAEIEMPRYKCHKEVYALKIKAIEVVHKEDDSVVVVITPEDNQYASFEVEEEYLKRYPVVGGYYVVYKGGYESFSPAKEFEEGYSRIN